MTAALALLLQAVFGSADPAQRFSPVPVPAPANVLDPCGDRGPAGQWVQMSRAHAPASIHRQSWLDSATVWTGGRMVVALRKDGKWNGSAFDPCANAWSPIAETQELAREEPWLTGDHDRPFVASHANGSADGFERILVWDAGPKKWVTVQSPPPLAPRGHYAVALAGRKLLVWGGWGHSMSTLGDGAVLDIERKTWKKMAVAGAPSPRLDPVVAWTGSRLLVWGGRHQSSPSSAVRMLGDGAQYDPTRDRWTPMSFENAPSPRTEPVVAWTGRKLVVAGGATQLGGTPLRDGCIYDPAADRWTPMGPLAGDVVLPKANVGPLTRILIAPGGRVVLLPDNLGAVVLLDAETARWSTLDAAGPGKRNSFRAFLAGRRLIVWGGQQLIAEHLCPPPVPGRPICDSWAETAPRDDGWMILLPR